MLKVPDDGDCPRCGAALEDAMSTIERADGTLEDEEVWSCPDCTYRYPKP